MALRRILLVVATALGSCRLALAADLQLRILDVGQGAAALISNGAKSVLIDTGPSDHIVEQLRRLGVDALDLLVVTHNHADHLGGADAILAAMPVRYYMDNGLPAKTKLQEVVLRLLTVKHVAYLAATRRTISVGDASLTVMPPPPDISGDQQNNRSVGLVLRRGDFVALVPGDSELEEIGYWLANEKVPQANVLVGAHHGSRNGVTPLWLHQVKPDVVILSVGAGNRYGHPHQTALRYYHASSRTVYRTDLQGEVLISVDSAGHYRVHADRRGPAVERSAQPTIPPPRKVLRPGAATDQSCCRVCHKGKACGDGCIAKQSLCRQPVGCACNG